MSVQTPDFSNLRPRVRVSSQKWEQLRPVVKNLYCDQGKTLADTRKVLKDVYGLNASEKTCKERIRDWGFRKNNKKPSRKGFKEYQESVESSDGMEPFPIILKNDQVFASTVFESVRHLNRTAESYEIQIPPLPKSLRLTWNGHNIKALNDMMSQAKLLEDQAYVLDVKEKKSKYEEAEDLYRKAHAGYEYLLGPKEQTWEAVKSIAQVCNLQGKPRKVEALLLETARQMSERYGEADYRTLESYEAFAKNLLLQGHFLDGELMLGRILDAYGFETIAQLGTKQELDKCRRTILLYVDAYLAVNDLDSDMVVELYEKDRMTKAAEMLFQLLNIYEALQLPEDPNLLELKSKLLMLYTRRPHLELDQRSIAFLMHELEKMKTLSVPVLLQMTGVASQILQRLQTHFQEKHNLEELSRLLENQESLIQLVIKELAVAAPVWATYNLEDCTDRSNHLLERHDGSHTYYEGAQEEISVRGKLLDDCCARNFWSISNFATHGKSGHEHGDVM